MEYRQYIISSKSTNIPCVVATISTQLHLPLEAGFYIWWHKLKTDKEWKMYFIN